MDDMITSRYVLTGDDYVELCVANHGYLWRSSPILRAGKVFFFGLALLVAVVWVASRRAMLTDPAILVRELGVPVVMVVGLAYLFHPRNWLNRLWYKHHFRSTQGGPKSIDWGFDPVQLWARTDLAESVFRWELFRTIVETPRCVLFFQGKQLALWFPAHAFSSPGMIASFTDLARAKVPNYVVVGECRFPAKPEPIGRDEL